MDLIKNSIAGLLCGGLMTLGILGVASLVDEDVKYELPEDEITAFRVAEKLSGTSYPPSEVD